jgi:hypothetical protein
MGVVADAHAQLFGLRGDPVELLGRVEPTLGALGPEAGDDEEGVAQDVMELGRGLQGVAGDGLDPRVRAAALEAVVIQQPSELLGLGVPAVVAGELDALVAHLADGFEDGRQALGRLLPDRIELDPDGDRLRGRGGGQR